MGTKKVHNLSHSSLINNYSDQNVQNVRTRTAPVLDVD